MAGWDAEQPPRPRVRHARFPLSVAGQWRVKEAGEISASIPNLPPAEREAATIRVAEMTRTAHDLLYGHPVPKFDHAALAGITRPGTGGNQPRP